MPHRRPITPPNEAQLVRVTKQQTVAIHQIAEQLAGAGVEVRLFGSRIDDAARGGDVDLLLDLPRAVDDPAMLAARMSAKVSRLMDGRRVDVVIKAPNLKQLPDPRGRRAGRANPLTLQPHRVERLRYLARVVGKQCAHLRKRRFIGASRAEQDAPPFSAT
jgi:hypothetical protein